MFETWGEEMRYVAVRCASLIRNVATFLGALTLVAALSVPVFAQNIESGAINGVVKDTQGGLVQGATVTITEPTKGVSKTATTGPDGSFEFLEIPPGDYSVTVDMTGFKTAAKTGIHVPVDTHINVGEMQLEIGSMSETVTVQAQAGQLALQTDSGERSGVVTGTQLRNLALNGANVTDMFKIVPGVFMGGTGTTNSALSSIGNLSINGLRPTEKQYEVDGMTNYNIGNETAGIVTVNIDALQEVKVETSNYSAEYGREGGGIISLTTKSGTSDFHGGASYFRRNQTMNADSVFNDANNAVITPTPYNKQPASLYQYNYYGWNVGGPVWIPHVFDGRKHKLYFFIDQEYYRQLVPVTSATNILVPCPSMLIGDFNAHAAGAVVTANGQSATDTQQCYGALSSTSGANGVPVNIVDPCPTGPAFTGNVIPLATVNPCTGSAFLSTSGLSILKALPAPISTSGGAVYNYSSEISNAYPRSETVLRGDYQISNSTRFSASWIHNHDDQQFNTGTTTASWNWPLDIVDRFNGPGNIESGTLTTNFGPTWVNELTGGSARGNVQIVPEGTAATDAATGISIPYLYPNANADNLIPSLSFGGTSGASFPSSSVTGIFRQHFNIYQISDNLSKVWGAHIFKFGYYFESSSNQSDSQSNTEGTVNFSSGAGFPTADTGFTYANALIGVYDNYSQFSNKVMQNYLYHDNSWYAEDVWKARPNLTLDLGIRFSYWKPTYDKGEGQSFFNPTYYSASMVPDLYWPVCIGTTAGQYYQAGTSTGAVCSGKSNEAVLASTTIPSAATLAAFGNMTNAQQVAATLPFAPYNDKEELGTGSLTNGMVQTPGTPGYPVAGFMTPSIIYQPRIGFAYDVGGHHDSVIRGGFGIAPDRYETESCGGGNVPLAVDPNLYGGYLQNITPVGSSSSTGAIGIPGVCGFAENSKFPVVYSYSMGFQKTIGQGTVLDVAYVGNQARHLLHVVDLNAVPYGADFTAATQDNTQYPGGLIPTNEATTAACPTATCNLYPEYVAAGVPFMGDHNYSSPDYTRPYLGYGTIQFFKLDANSNYNSLQVELSRSFQKTLTFTAAYTHERVYTDAGGDTTVSDYLGANKFNYGPDGQQHSNIFIASFVWNMPGLARFAGKGFVARAVLNNWILSGITTLESGGPAGLPGLSISGVNASQRIEGTPSADGGESVQFYLNGTPQYGTANNSINAAALVVPQIGQIGPFPVNPLRQPGIYNQDLSLFKNIPFNESGSRYVQLRLEAFNVLNHPTYGGFNTSTSVTNALGQSGATIFSNYSGLTAVPAASFRNGNTTQVLGHYFGEYTSANPQRVLQIAAKFYF